MLITPSSLNVFFTALETRFWTALGTAPVVSKAISTTYPCKTEVWLSGWTDMLDKFRQWNGPRVVHTPAPITYPVPVLNWELTEGIDLFKLEDDTYGIYNPVVSYMGEQAAKWPDYQFRDLLQNQGAMVGGFQNGYDGLTFFNTAHQVDYWDASKGTYCNDFTGGGVSVNGITVGGALQVNSFATAWENMARIKTASGEAWGLTGSLSIVSPMLKITLDTILQAQFTGAPVIGNLGVATAYVGSTENLLRAWTDSLMWPDLGGSGTVGGGTQDSVWYMGDFKKPIKPLSWVLHSAPDFVYRVSPDDPVVFDTHTVNYGSKARGTPAWGFPAMMLRSSP
jgi:phage major head subunit gpT-like protein